jgi:5-methyltetrahydropteroyltriglutamate--homocysteine methyltransferase
MMGGLPGPVLDWESWLVSGSYEPLARRIFGRVRAGRLMLEYDDERSGGFEPLAHVPEDKIAVLGLVTTKTPRRESPQELEARIREASGFIPLERLALSPQCGFATSVIGNAVTVEDEEHKLRAIVETAEKVWGSSGAITGLMVSCEEAGRSDDRLSGRRGE